MRIKRTFTRKVQPDPRYNSTKIAKLVNSVMHDGKKSVAQKQVYQALESLEKTTGKKALEVFDEVVGRVSPQVEVRSRRIGGAAYQVPTPVRPQRAFALALRWLIQEARKRPNSQYQTFAQKLTAEMTDALKDQGGAVEHKNTAHRMAESNKAFAHFRW
ncbi:MAG TPA: 30S ribosomal protein S7 [Candidatus Woesebacteria bacterium]|nr:30S ribosomal protein S7 [Candidatus Woesebacteria bacterium]